MKNAESEVNAEYDRLSFILPSDIPFFNLTLRRVRLSGLVFSNACTTSKIECLISVKASLFPYQAKEEKKKHNSIKIISL